MKRELPPLNSLRAFEAAARHLSMSKAADELAVTHAAISHQIKGLEEWLGQPLFDRAHRQISLTPAGEDLLAPVSDGLDRIARRVDMLRQTGKRTSLTISAAPGVAYRWIVPRVARYMAERGDVDIRLQHDMRLVDLQRDDVDVAIRHGIGGWQGVHQVPLIRAFVQPMASDAFLRQNGYTPADLPLTAEQIAALPLQYDSETRASWAAWFDKAGAPGVDLSKGAVFDNSTGLIDVALAGQGVVLAPVPLAKKEIDAGILHLLSEQCWGNDQYYWFLSSDRRKDEPLIADLRAFMEASATDADWAPPPRGPHPQGPNSEAGAGAALDAAR